MYLSMRLYLNVCVYVCWWAHVWQYTDGVWKIKMTWTGYHFSSSNKGMAFNSPWALLECLSYLSLFFRHARTWIHTHRLSISHDLFWIWIWRIWNTTHLSISTQIQWQVHVAKEKEYPGYSHYFEILWNSQSNPTTEPLYVVAVVTLWPDAVWSRVVIMCFFRQANNWDQWRGDE